MSAPVSYVSRNKSVYDLRNLYEKGSLNLTPGFQRNSVWGLRDRQTLIDSMLRGYPIPAIFLYSRSEKGQTIYDVIDGKQRLETIFKFAGIQRGAFDVKVQFSGTETLELINWPLLKKSNRQQLIDNYQIITIEVDGDFTDIVDLFVKINSTGKALTRAEKTKAKYFSSIFLKVAAGLVEKHRPYFLSNRILTTDQLSRMKHVELICELMLSLHRGDVLNKKSALDKIMVHGAIDGRQIQKVKRTTDTIFKLVRSMFPDIKTTRFSKISDFYTLAFLVGKYNQEGLVLIEKKRNALAWDLLKSFGRGVDEVTELQRRAEGVTADQEVYRDYLLTVKQGTDEINQRRKRETIIDGVLRSIFLTKDKKRTFSKEQRRIMWHNSDERTCHGCGAVLTWDNFTLDHVDPYSRGGQTQLRNAALTCRECNAAKGNRRGAVGRIGASA